MEVLYKYRFILVIALLGGAAALLTPRGRLPLALRGLRKMVDRDLGRTSSAPPAQVPRWRRLVAFAMTLAAFLLACL